MSAFAYRCPISSNPIPVPTRHCRRHATGPPACALICDAETSRRTASKRASTRWRQSNRMKRDRKSVGEGKSVSVRVDLGGRRTIKKKKQKHKTEEKKSKKRQ